MQLAEDLKTLFPDLHYVDRHLMDMHLWIPVRDTGASCLDRHSAVVETSVATGITQGSLLGRREWIAAGTPLSYELASVIQSTLLWGDFCLPASLGDQFGTLDDHAFFARKLKQSRDAGSQLKGAMETFFSQLNERIGGVGSWTISQTLIGEQCYQLCSGMIADVSESRTKPMVVGVAKVEFYEVIGIFDSRGVALPESIVRADRDRKRPSGVVVIGNVIEEAI